MVEKYRIIGENIYNFNEKRFMIGFGIILIWVITHKQLVSGEIIEISQDSSRK